MILVIAIGFSKRSTGTMTDELGGASLPFSESGDKDAPSDLLRSDVAAGAHGLNRNRDGEVAVAIDLVIERFGDDTVLIEQLRVRRAQVDESGSA